MSRTESQGSQEDANDQTRAAFLADSLYVANESQYPEFCRSDGNPASASELGTIHPSSTASYMFDSENLIDAPRKVEKIPIGFAKRAKRIDVKKLKQVMWSQILEIPQSQTQSMSTTTNHDSTVVDPTTDSNKTLTTDDDKATEEESNNDGKDENMDETVTQKDTDKEEANVTIQSTTTADDLQSESRFSTIYRHLPLGISKSMSDNLSVPLAFTCLLHLANEKQLRITGVNDLSDLNIQMKED